MFACFPVSILSYSNERWIRNLSIVEKLEMPAYHIHTHTLSMYMQNPRIRDESHEFDLHTLLATQHTHTHTQKALVSPQFVLCCVDERMTIWGFDSCIYVYIGMCVIRIDFRMSFFYICDVNGGDQWTSYVSEWPSVTEAMNMWMRHKYVWAKFSFQILTYKRCTYIKLVDK